MTFEDELEAARRNAEKRGEERGIAIGERRGRAEGEKRKAVELAIKLVRTGTMGAVDAAAFAGVDPGELKSKLAQENE